MSFLCRLLPFLCDTPSPEPAMVSMPLDAINRQRSKRGLVAVREDARLMSMAKDWSTHMSRHGMSHGDFGRRIGAVYPNRFASENIGYGYKSVDDVVSAWMESPGHRTNILGNFTHCGIGSAQASDGVWYWCAVFVRLG